MPGYHVRSATVSDIDVLVRHRLGMFAEMGTSIADGVAGAFGQWLEQMLPAEAYKAWLVQTDDGHVVAGGGLTILPWPPGPNAVASRVAFVYNVSPSLDASPPRSRADTHDEHPRLVPCKTEWASSCSTPARPVGRCMSRWVTDQRPRL